LKKNLKKEKKLKNHKNPLRVSYSALKCGV